LNKAIQRNGSSEMWSGTGALEVWGYVCSYTILLIIIFKRQCDYQILFVLLL